MGAVSTSSSCLTLPNMKNNRRAFFLRLVPTSPTSPHSPQLDPCQCRFLHHHPSPPPSRALQQVGLLHAGTPNSSAQGFRPLLDASCQLGRKVIIPLQLVPRRYLLQTQGEWPLR